MEEKYPGYVWDIDEREVEFEPTEAMEIILQTHDPELVIRKGKVSKVNMSINMSIIHEFIQ